MEVSKELLEVIDMTVDKTLNKTNDMFWTKQREAMADEAFRNTEKALYCYNALKEHVEDEKGYLTILEKKRSGSIIRYSKNKTERPDVDQILEGRLLSYERSKNEIERIEKALKKIEGKRGYEVIQMRYLQRKKTVEDGKEKEDIYTFEEIAEILSGQQGYSNNFNEKTARNYKNTLIRDVAISLFGADAI